MNACEPPIDLRNVARSFSAAADTYDANAALQREVADSLASYLGHEQGSVNLILDLGSGTGYCSRQLRQAYPDALLVNADLAEGMLQYHQRTRPDSRAVHVCADASRLPFAGSSFDLVFSSLALQWCPEPAMAFEQIRRSSRPGGRVLVSTLGPATLVEVRQLWQEVDDYPHVNRFQTREHVLESARDSGLEILSCHTRTLYRHYPDLHALSAEMKGLGAGNHHRHQARGLSGRDKLRKLQQAFTVGCKQGLFSTTYEIILLDMEVIA